MRRSSALQGVRRSSSFALVFMAGASLGYVAWRNGSNPAAHPDQIQQAKSMDASTPRADVPMMARAASPMLGVSAAGAATPPQPSAVSLLERARQARSRGDNIAARTDFSLALSQGLPPDVAPGVRNELSALAEKTLFSRMFGTGDPLVVKHRVQTGETLSRIAAKYQVSEDLVARLNGLANKRHVRSGMMLHVVEGPFRVVVDKAAFRLDVFLRNTLVHSYTVGLGTNGSTPTGTWRVVGKLKNPSWSDPRTGRRYAADDPANPIGERWIGLEGLTGDAVGKVGFGIHGTVDPGSIGHNASLGCVRMLPDDVAQIYDWLVEGHSTVEVR